VREQRSDQVWLAKKREVKTRNEVVNLARGFQGSQGPQGGCSGCSGELTGEGESRVISA
jgi:hypothetical protein